MFFSTSEEPKSRVFGTTRHREIYATRIPSNLSLKNVGFLFMQTTAYKNGGHMRFRSPAPIRYRQQLVRLPSVNAHYAVRSAQYIYHVITIPRNWNRELVTRRP